MPFWFFARKRSVHKRINNLEKNLSDSFINLRKDMNKVGVWIDHFKQKHGKHDERLNIIEHKLEDLCNLVKNSKAEHSEAIEHVQSFNRSNASFMNVQSFKNIQNLTPAQKQVLILLAYAGGPLDYESISEKLKLNIVTVRRHINDLKRGGMPIIEKVSVRNRRKVFLIDNEAKKNLLCEDQNRVKLDRKTKK